MTTEFKPRPSGYLNDDRDWYDAALDDLVEHLCNDTAYPFAQTDGEREAANYVARIAITRFIFRFEPALTNLRASDAFREAQKMAHRRIIGTHPSDLDYEADQHFGPYEIRTVWGPRAEQVLADSEINAALAYRYRLDHVQANHLRERMGLPLKPDPDLTGFMEGEDW